MVLFALKRAKATPENEILPQIWHFGPLNIKFKKNPVGNLKLASKGGFNLVAMSVGALILCNGFFMKSFDPEIKDFL